MLTTTAINVCLVPLSATRRRSRVSVDGHRARRLVISRGDVWWADLRILEGSLGFRQPVLVISDDRYNASRLGTAIIVVLSSTARLAALPGNVAVTAALSGLDRDFVVDVTHVRTVDRAFLEERVGQLPTVVDDPDRRRPTAARSPSNRARSAVRRVSASVGVAVVRRVRGARWRMVTAPAWTVGRVVAGPKVRVVVGWGARGAPRRVTVPSGRTIAALSTSPVMAVVMAWASGCAGAAGVEQGLHVDLGRDGVVGRAVGGAWADELEHGGDDRRLVGDRERFERARVGHRESAPVTRATGRPGAAVCDPCRSVAPMPPSGQPSSTRTARPVRRTEAAIVAWSSGRTDRRSMTSASMPCSSARRAAAASATIAMRELATMLTSLPGRRTTRGRAARRRLRQRRPACHTARCARGRRRDRRTRSRRPAAPWRRPAWPAPRRRAQGCDATTPRSSASGSARAARRRPGASARSAAPTAGRPTARAAAPRGGSAGRAPAPRRPPSSAPPPAASPTAPPRCRCRRAPLPSSARHGRAPGRRPPTTRPSPRRPTAHADVLAHQQHALVALQPFAQRFAKRLAVGDLAAAHGATMCSYNVLASGSGDASASATARPMRSRTPVSIASRSPSPKTPSRPVGRRTPRPDPRAG